MTEQYVAGKSVAEWERKYPLIKEIRRANNVFWINPAYQAVDRSFASCPLSAEDVAEADERLKRFAPCLLALFPETGERGGIIESPLIRIPAMQTRLKALFNSDVPGTLLLKCDSHLAVSGSIKARGGFHEVLRHAETLAMSSGMLTGSDDYAILATERFRRFFSGYSIAVGSTGNLGLSIGIMGSTLGFAVHVHMSSDAKQWKKDLLIRHGVTVIEHDSDYSLAVARGREQAENNPKMHFVDDERSQDLFLGYAAAASRLKIQLDRAGLRVDNDHPLMVYLPCGVGGGPGGIAFGLKQLFGNAVHCFFAEPSRAPCMLLGLMTGQHEQISVQEFGLDGRTEADGLAVGRPSGFVGRTVGPMISGVYTVDDDVLFALLYHLHETESVALEPSAVAGLPGPQRLFRSSAGKTYLEKHGITGRVSQRACHIVWATGGSMVPQSVMNGYLERGSLFPG